MSDRRIFVRLKGGIGNQLFQFAYALLLGGGRAGSVFCVLDYFQRDTRHGGFALDQLLGSEVQTLAEVPSGGRCLCLNADLVADEDLTRLGEAPVDLFLDGYFQNVRHVLPVLDTLRDMFRRQFDETVLRAQLQSHARLAAEEVMLAIHLRRGDFLDPAVRRVHGVPAPQSMADCVARLVPQPAVAVVFSDSREDIDLPCRKVNLTGVRGSLSQDIEQFRLIACCDAVVASNSTFSYWAGLLSGRVRQLFIPSPWMRSNSVRTSALLAEGVQAFPTELL